MSRISRNLPKGLFGNAIMAPRMQVDLRIPYNIRLKLDSGRVERHVGNRLARVIRARLRRGEDGDGTALPVPRDGKPAKVTGRLIRHIRYLPKAGVVAPDWRRSRPDVSNRARSSYGLMRIHIAEGRWEDPMGSENPEQWKDVGEWTEEAIAKELESGRGSLQAELKRITRIVPRGDQRR